MGKFNQKLIITLVSLGVHSIMIWVLLLLSAPGSFEEKRYIVLDFEFKPEFEKKELKTEQHVSVPGYKNTAFAGNDVLEDIDVINDTLKVVKFLTFENVKYDVHSMVSLRNLSSFLLRKKFHQQDSLDHFSRELIIPPSQAFNFESYNKELKPFNPPNLLNKNTGKAIGIEIPIIPMLKFLGIL